MLCYRDRTYCSETTCVNTKCNLLLTDEMAGHAQVWWNGKKPIEEWTEVPIAFSDFKDTEFCIGYKNKS